MPFRRNWAWEIILPSPVPNASTAAGREPSPGTRSMRSGRGQPYLTTNSASSSSVTSGAMFPIQRFISTVHIGANRPPRPLDQGPIPPSLLALAQLPDRGELGRHGRNRRLGDGLLFVALGCAARVFGRLQRLRGLGLVQIVAPDRGV